MTTTFLLLDLLWVKPADVQEGRIVNIFLQYAKTCMPGCQRFQKRLNAQPRGLEGNIVRDMDSPVMFGAGPAKFLLIS